MSEISDEGKNPQVPVSSYFYSCFPPISICENAKKPETSDSFFDPKWLVTKKKFTDIIYVLPICFYFYPYNKNTQNKGW